MLEGNWLRSAKAIGLTFGAVFLLGFLVGKVNQTEPRERIPESYEACEKGDLTHCETKPPDLNYVAQNPGSADAQQESRRNEYREEKDLRAQQHMANWALAVSILTGLGVVLLFVTWLETIKVTKETKRIGEAQTRAYLTVVHAMLKYENRTPTLRLTIRNAGQSPAKNIQISIGIDYGRRRATQRAGFRARIPIMPGASEPFPLRLFNQRYPLSFRNGLKTAPANAKRHRRIRLFGVIDFVDVFDEKQAPLAFSFDAFLDGPKRLEHPIQLGRSPIKANHND